MEERALFSCEAEGRCVDKFPGVPSMWGRADGTEKNKKKRENKSVGTLLIWAWILWAGRRARFPPSFSASIFRSVYF